MYSRGFLGGFFAFHCEINWILFIIMFQKLSGTLLLIFLASGLFAQAASRTDGENVFYI
jgi:hypothetical protein